MFYLIIFLLPFFFLVENFQGYLMLIIQSHYTNLQPQPCGESSCIHGTKALLFYLSICLLGLGGGGIRGAVPALGADQFNQNDPKQKKYIASFFNWFLLSITVGATVGVTVVVWVSSNVGWDRGFIIYLVCSFVGLLFASLGKPLYRVRVSGENSLLSVLEVHLSLSLSPSIFLNLYLLFINNQSGNQLFYIKIAGFGGGIDK